MSPPPTLNSLSQSAAPYASPLFAPLRQWLDMLPPHPDQRALSRLAERYPVFAASGQRIRFSPPYADGRAYEERIWETGNVETRSDNWHDFFNGLVWLTFPKSKATINAAHVAAPPAQGSARGSARDALTHFDECGIVVLATRPELLELLRSFCWKTLFVDRRSDVIAAMRFVVFGHATYHSLLAPFFGLTAKSVLYVVEDDCLRLSAGLLTAMLDARLAADLAAGVYSRPRDFQPLPLLGIPGVVAANECADYYDDTRQFRAGRRCAGNAVTRS
ncbi:DUF3025 domain-containing protein [Accumulibacter sp.]|uniref:DUF3025 domain-containing protein n=1 Tax=Accumulibacter sp. TaxID=2053492 RepID=UPI002C34A512|nr:DUF3025 domain-containing protein [Accumulibacter sp.]HNB67505.1 DUF3025 domain-containing protein [Accumulibacter sp.]HNM64020.1 DUF3025 domain-containing protein [Accumulibacter sp.]